MADHRDFHFAISPATEAHLINIVTRYIADHLAANRHPDGVAPAMLAEDLVTRLRASLSLYTAEDLERET
jgi:hypothetical protein